MKSKQVGFVLMALIAIGVAGILYRVISSGGTDFRMEGLMPISQDVIDRIEISKSGERAELVRIGEVDWRVGKNPTFAPRMSDFWLHVTDIPDAQLVARNPKHHSVLGVDENSGIELTFYLGQAVQEEFLVGKWSPDVKLCYVRKAGKDEVYGIPCSRDNVFSANSDSWRNPIVASIPPGDIESFDFIYPDSSLGFSVTKVESGWEVSSQSGLEGMADERVIDMILQALAVVPAMGFVEDTEQKALDFAAPDGAIRINTFEGANSPTTRLKFIRNDELTYYVKTPSQSTVFLVDANLSEFLLMNKENILLPD
ncbi:MAG TPA: DUF4340 domain-containing protein [Dehalococcoidia bacterium]|nr:DUF4340 domain-containing protein [Dehalococcoidia bacterium]